MGRPKAPRWNLLTEAALDRIASVAAAKRTRCDMMILDPMTVEALVTMARFGKGLATIQAQPPAQRTASARKAATARWARARAQRTESTVQEREGVTEENQGGVLAPKSLT
jgi:hypothetical protein